MICNVCMYFYCAMFPGRECGSKHLSTSWKAGTSGNANTRQSKCWCWHGFVKWYCCWWWCGVDVDSDGDMTCWWWNGNMVTRWIFDGRVQTLFESWDQKRKHLTIQVSSSLHKCYTGANVTPMLNTNLAQNSCESLSCLDALPSDSPGEIFCDSSSDIFCDSSSDIFVTVPVIFFVTVSVTFLWQLQWHFCDSSSDIFCDSFSDILVTAPVTFLVTVPVTFLVTAPVTPSGDKHL